MASPATPTESSILTSFLLLPSPLPTFLPLSHFTALFPRSLQSHPQVRLLYAYLQQQRALDADDVRANIAEEVRRGEKLQRLVEKARAEAEQEEAEEEAEVHQEEREAREKVKLMNSFDLQSRCIITNMEADRHSLHSFLVEMERASGSIEDEIQNMKRKEARLLQEMKTTIENLSDLRYGKFDRLPGSQNRLGEEVVEDLMTLEKVCERKQE